MMKTKAALALVLSAFALSSLAPVDAKPQKSGKAKTSKSAPARKPAPKNVPKNAPKAAAKPVARAAAPAAPAVSERRQDKAFDTLTVQFLNALWRIAPEDAVLAGKFDTAALMTVPDKAHRDAMLAFIGEWRGKFGAVKASDLSVRQRTDLGLLLNKLDADQWYLTTFKEYEWNPASYSIAAPLDFILNTKYAGRPQRLRTLLKRLDKVPAYYQAAQAAIVNPTHEHTQLAIRQAPGNQSVLNDIEKNVNESTQLTPAERTLFKQRLAAARAAIDGYVSFLTALDQQQMAAGTARPFRIGRDVYEQKFKYDIQSASSAEQTYQKALAARDELLTRMDALSDQLWDKTMGAQPKPADRLQKIGMVIDKLSVNHVKREDFFAEIRRQIPQLQEYVNAHNLLTLDASKPLVVRETPVYERGVAGASIEAPGPYRPQDRTWYNVTPLDGLTPEQAESTLREYNTWILQVLNMHEAIPGHYAQLVYANKSPSIVKALFGNGAMVEGWAVYGERMMMESGYGDAAPEMWLMYCKWNLRTVTNVILDYNVHVLGMTEPQAVDLLTRQAFQTQAEAVEKWHRVQVTSVQLTSYFSGYSDIMDLREQRKQALGGRFNLKDFNEQFLSYGNAPVRVIRELMTAQ
ncbi:DUF885 domain-containing protein [Massilia arenosa]|uniref:DUF885 domain-containing protein n=1 Tax=Zemynaea arenosa TaxID=2561931 RepID=A0A4Y9RU57_9BURK|nr:DUF885 domain-containing protein [Massilia arenosa]TFW10778.1 DUF885 domain-containing protein [Massilia arenosa]